MDFECPGPDDFSGDFVENFLKNKSVPYQEKDLATTHLLIEETKESQRVIGYFTLFLDHIELEESKLNENEWPEMDIDDLKFFPAIRIHSLGVDANHRCSKLGYLLVSKAYEYSKEIAEIAGCAFVTVESFQSAVGFYKKNSFQPINAQNGRQDEDYLDMAIHIAEIEEYIN